MQCWSNFSPHPKANSCCIHTQNLFFTKLAFILCLAIWFVSMRNKLFVEKSLSWINNKFYKSKENRRKVNDRYWYPPRFFENWGNALLITCHSTLEFSLHTGRPTKPLVIRKIWVVSPFGVKDYNYWTYVTLCQHWKHDRKMTFFCVTFFFLCPFFSLHYRLP